MHQSTANRVYFMGRVVGDVLPACAALHSIIRKQAYRDVILDFSAVVYLDPKFMVPLVSTIQHHRLSGVDFELILPVEVSSRKLFEQANWAHLICPELHDRYKKTSRRHLSAFPYLNAEQHLEAVNKSIGIMLQRVPGLNRVRIQALEWALNEVTDNVLNDAHSDTDGILQVVTFPQRKRVEFYVCDSGMGVGVSLRTGRPDFTTDVQAVRAAIDEGVTRNKLTNQGNGLYGTFKCCEISQGEFDLLSGNAHLAYRGGSLTVKTNAIPFHGTFVRASINYETSDLLRKALVFRGKAHTPSFDYIEKTYQENDDLINFIMKREVNAFGSRDAGRLARTKIENLMDERSETVICDFAEIEVISSSFADEVFGKLLLELGSVRFRELIRLRNTNSTVQALIDRAITKRADQLS